MGALKALGNQRPNSHNLGIGNPIAQQVASTKNKGKNVLTLEAVEGNHDAAGLNEETKEIVQNVKISASPPSIVVSNPVNR